MGGSKVPGTTVTAEGKDVTTFKLKPVQVEEDWGRMGTGSAQK